MSGWKWQLQKNKAEYHALFPRAWTVYQEAVPDLQITIRQVSPVLPNNYSDSSLPVAVFHVEVHNGGAEAEVAVMFSFQVFII